MEQHNREIMQWLKTNFDISTVTQSEIYERYYEKFKDNYLHKSKALFGRFLNSQLIGRRSIRVDGKTLKAFDISQNSHLEYIPPMAPPVKQKCDACDGKGFTLVDPSTILSTISSVNQQN